LTSTKHHYLLSWNQNAIAKINTIINATAIAMVTNFSSFFKGGIPFFEVRAARDIFLHLIPYNFFYDF
jgi:hypothetical protein